MEPPSLIESNPHRIVAGVVARFGRLLRWWSAARGMALLAIAAVIAAAGSFAFDFAFEPSRAWRVVGLAVILTALGWIAWRRILGPLTMRLVPSALAIALERRDPAFDARLATAIELPDHPLAPALLSRVNSEAAEIALRTSSAAQLSLKSTFRLVTLAILALGGFTVLATTRGDLATTWWRRSVLLETVRYPRATTLAVLRFTDGVRKVGRGRDVELVMTASGKIPDRATLETIGGRGAGRRRDILTVSPSGEFRTRFRSVLQPVEFTVAAGDERTDTLRLEPVDPPGVTRVDVAISPPTYTGRQPRTMEWTTGAIEVPVGSRITVRATFDQSVTLLETKVSGIALSAERPTSETCIVEWEAVENKRLRIVFANVDGIESDEPFTLDLTAVEDRLPTIEKVEPMNVGPAVTRLAAIPFSIDVKDDYGVESAAVVLTKPGNNQPIRFPFPLDPGTSELNQPLVELGPLKFKEGDKFTAMIEASDLPPSVPFLGEPWTTLWTQRTVKSPGFVFEVVAPDELQARLAARELNYRQRFEQTLRECRAARTSLSDAAAAKDAGSTLQRLRVDEALHSIRKSANETRELAAAFFGLIEEYRNNRVGATGAIERLERSVATPLRKFANESFALRISEIQSAEVTISTLPRRR